MMDLSDGLGADLPRLAAASGLGFRVQEELLPVRQGFTAAQAVADGEDYELLMTFPPAAVKKSCAWPPNVSRKRPSPSSVR